MKPKETRALKLTMKLCPAGILVTDGVEHHVTAATSDEAVKAYARKLATGYTWEIEIDDQIAGRRREQRWVYGYVDGGLETYHFWEVSEAGKETRRL